MTARTSHRPLFRRFVAPLALLLAASSCKGGAGGEGAGQEEAATETNASTTTGESATVTGVVSDDSAFAPGAPSVPVAGTNLWLSSDAQTSTPKIYALGADGTWVYHADATLSGEAFTASAPVGAYLMLVAGKLAATLPPAAADAELGVVVDRSSTIGSVLFQAALDGDGKGLAEAKSVDYPSLQEVASLFSRAANRSRIAPKLATLGAAADILVKANKDLAAALAKLDASEETVREAFVAGPTRVLTAQNTVEKVEAGTYDARAAALAMASLPATLDEPASARQAVSEMADAENIATFRGVVKEDVFARTWDAVAPALANNAKAVVTKAKAAMWASVDAMTDKTLGTAAAANAKIPELDERTESLVGAIQEAKEPGALSAYLETFCATIDCTANPDPDGTGGDSDDEPGDDTGSDTGSGTDDGDQQGGDDDQQGDGDEPSGPAPAHPGPPVDVRVTVDGQALRLGWTLGENAAGTLIVRRPLADPTFVPEDGQTYTVGQTAGDSEIVYVGSGLDFLDDHVGLGTEEHYALFSYSGGNLYSIAANAVGTVATSYRVTRSPTIAANYPSGMNSDWTSPANVYADDGADASVLLDNSPMLGTSKDLLVYGFDFSAIPMNATIIGIQVNIDRMEVSGYGLDHVRDASVKLLSGLVAVGADKASTVPWPIDTPTVATYGGPTDLWDYAWTRPDFEASAFALMLRVTRAASQDDATRAQVDHISVSVDYTLP